MFSWFVEDAARKSPTPLRTQGLQNYSDSQPMSSENDVRRLRAWLPQTVFPRGL